LDCVIWFFAAQPGNNGIVRGVTRIAIPWWCKRKNRSLNEAKMQRAIEEVDNPVPQVS